MKPDALGKNAADVFSGRFFLVSYVPTLAFGVFLLVLVWAGAPGAQVDFSAAWRTAARLRAGEWLLLVLGITLAALLTHPLQLALVRVLEGHWPAAVRLPAALGLRRQRRRRARLARASEPAGGAPDDARIQAAGVAGARLRELFPPADRLLPTALGNVLAAMEGRAGSGYGWDAPVAWPRLYPVLGEQMKAVVDDRRNTLDAAVRLSATTLWSGLVTLILLARAGWWPLLALLPLTASWIAYQGAVRAGVAYGEAITAAFDLHRFDLLTSLHLPLPADRDEERRQAADLCAHWRQGKPLALVYDHPDNGGVPDGHRCS
ncbi:MULTISPECIES: hypothetical protein [unclassified Streptomyces]|uniref:hypothetical protein n=1 Tax=unclassified Streptomyces TaxID=2593676 RepID=UPI0037A818F7